MSNTLLKSLIKSLEKAYGQYGAVNGEVKPRTYNSIYSIARPKKNPKPTISTTSPYSYVYKAPSFANNTAFQPSINSEMQEFQQAQKQLLQNQRTQQLYRTTRNAGQNVIQNPTIISQQNNQSVAPKSAMGNYTPKNITEPTNPNPAQSTENQMETSIEDTNPARSTGASILGTTTKRYSGIRKSSKSTEYTSQYMYEGTGKVPNIPSTNRSIPRTGKYF